MDSKARQDLRIWVGQLSVAFNVMNALSPFAPNEFIASKVTRGQHLIGVISQDINTPHPNWEELSAHFKELGVINQQIFESTAKHLLKQNRHDR